ncbi:MAG: hypothetical protein WCY25_05465 [Moheibacter sp.]
MKKILMLLGSGIILWSCGEKQTTIEGELSETDIERMEETSQMNSDAIEYEGTFKGKIKGNEIELKLDGDTFEIIENGKRIHGSWSRLNDGTSIELEPDNGKISVRFYGYSDNDTWVALTDSATYPQNEEYLKRIPD